MANENSVYSFESNFISALELTLDIALTQTLAFGEQAKRLTPRIEVGFDYGGADPVNRMLTSTRQQYLGKHSGTISIVINGTVKDEHLALVGQVRSIMSWNVPALISPALEYYQVQNVFEQGGSNEAGDNEADFEIKTEMSFDIVFFIPPNSFDASNVIKANENALFFGSTQLFNG